MTGTIGIMAHRIGDRALYVPLHRAAMEAGFRRLIVFAPADVDWIARQVCGWACEDGGWRQAAHPFPDVIYDIGYYADRRDLRLAAKVKRQSGIPFVADWIGNKWAVHRKLSSSCLLLPYLLPTQHVDGPECVLSMLRRYGPVMLKPVSRHGGEGIVKIGAAEGRYNVEWSGEPGQACTREQLAQTVHALRGKRRYVVQQWIDVPDREDRVFDIRVYVHRTVRGEWKVAAAGVRQGAPGRITSNLATGGTALEAMPFLTGLFGEERAAAAMDELAEVSLYVPEYLQRYFHKRLVHLGLDFVIDRRGRAWMIEVNTKPGREIVKQIGGREAEEESYLLPMQHAFQLARAKASVQACVKANVQACVKT